VGGLLAGIDLGTSGVKLALFDVDGRPRGMGRGACAVEAPRTGWAQADPELWWRATARALAEACAEAGTSPGEIAAVGMGVLFPTVAPLDGQLRPLHPSILYNDGRSVAQVAAIERVMPRAAYESVTGNALVPGTCAATSIRWLADERPAVYRAARVFAGAHTYLAARLTGEIATDPSHAALSGLVDIRDPTRWSQELCDALGVDVARLPRIAASAEAIGGVCPRAARQTGLRAGTPVAIGAGDAPAGCFGAGARDGRTAVYLAGSSDCLTVPLRCPRESRAWVNCAYIPPGVWLGIGTATSSGASADWCAREVFGEGGFAAMVDAAAQSPAGAGGVTFLPYLQGERTPVWDPRARGLFVGLTLATTRGALARAVLEGTAFALRQVFESLGATTAGDVAEIRAVGGGARSAVWNQIKADVLGRPLSVLEFQDTGTRGAALMGALGAGIYASFDEAVSVAERALRTRTVQPEPARAALYDEAFDRYARLYPATKDVMHERAGG
jgi:xylulokinase